MAKTDTPGGRLRAFRTERALTGPALAKDLGCTKGTISYWESGRTLLPWTVCLALEAAHGVSAQWLATGEGPMWIVPGKRKPRTNQGVYLIPFLDEELGFSPDGSPILPHPDSPTLGFAASLLKEVVGGGLPEQSELYLWRARDTEMAPLLPLGAWVLLDVSIAACATPVENAIYLVRLGHGCIPCLRRVATEPLSGDLLVLADANGRVPLRIARSVAAGEFALLARAIWAGISLTS